MDVLALKLLVTPALIGGASLAGRRWGPEFSGWLVALPFTSGPVAFFLALDHGVHFASGAAVFILAGAMSQSAFSFGYVGTARYGLAPALLAGLGCFAAITLGLDIVPMPTVVLVPVVFAALFLGNLFFPAGPRVQKAIVPGLPAWDIPLRMFLATAIVLLITGVAPTLGPRLTGLLSPFPVYAAIMTLFAHRIDGPAAAGRVLHGLLLGLFSFAAFFLVIALTIEPFGIVPAFAFAILAALATQAATFLIVRGRHRQYDVVTPGME